MSPSKEVPTLRGEPLYIPFVGAIIERKDPEGGKEILIQIREKKEDSGNSGKLEIPGGKMRAYEDIYQTVRREAREESGLEITFIHHENQRIDWENRGDISTLIEPFCVTQMRNGPFIGLIFLCQAVGEPAFRTEETKEARWIPLEELKRIATETPESIYTPFLAPLKKYLSI